jgi:hypothetical protein
MSPEIHLAKAARFERTVTRLDPTDDFEAIMWAYMHVSTHWANAVFHAKELTDIEFDFEHTFYIDRSPDRERILAGLDESISPLLDILAIFEGLRTTYVRGSAPFGPEVLKRSQDALQRARDITEDVFGPLAQQQEQKE